MDARQERGLAMARATTKIRKQADGHWIVPSATISAFYFVNVERGTCSCPDYETRRQKCKHQWAVHFMRYRAERPDGSVVEETRVRVTYQQNWSNYNASQCEEKARVQELLRALCDGIEQPVYRGRGRPPLPLADVVFGATMKVYVGMSGRRATTDVRACEEKGLVDHAAHYNSLFNYVEKPELTPLLKSLVEEAALPLRAVESQFAVDSTGFGTSTYHRWFDKKYGREMQAKRFVKAHVITGCKTNVIAGIEVTDENVHDNPVLPSLVKGAADRGFSIAECSADKAYLSNSALDAIEAAGGRPLVPFKSNSVNSGGAAWRKLWHLFNYRRDEFLASYHQRSNVETTFSAMKKKFGSAVRSKLPVAQRNEVYLKALCYNLATLVHEMRELGVEPTFGATTRT